MAKTSSACHRELSARVSRQRRNADGTYKGGNMTGAELQRAWVRWGKIAKPTPTTTRRKAAKKKAARKGRRR